MALNEADRPTIIKALQEQIAELDKIKAACDAVKAACYKILNDIRD